MKNLKLYSLLILCLLNLKSTSQTIDSLEYATGNLSAQQQLFNYALPRFKPDHSLNRNFIWFGLQYFSEQLQPGISNQQMIANAKINNVEFYKNWNYYFMVNSNIGSYSSPSNYLDTLNVFNGAMVAIAKRNPTWKTSAICFWAQINGNVTDKNLSSDHYLRNNSNQFLDLNGNIISSNKFWSPVAPNFSIISDGQKQRNHLLNLTNALGRPVNIINENGEVIPLISRNGGVINNDPFVRTDYLNLGYPSSLNINSTNDYRGRKFTEQTILYRDQFLTLSPSTIFTHYGLDGQIDYRPVWNRSKFINSTINGRYYSTGDFYPRYPNNCVAWAGAWHGLGWFADTKFWEMKNGDSLMSPFVCAGWNIDETKNVRPAQYLGCLKILSNWGAEFFYTGYFSLSAPFPNPKNWGWQSVMPVYAQAITSRYEDLLRNGYSLNGDVPIYFLTTTTLNPNNPKYLFYTGDNRQFVAVRKSYSNKKYVISTMMMNNDNFIGTTPINSVGTFLLDGDSLKVQFRRQGSVYIFDKSNQNKIVFYQLDKWHEYKHPERWSKNIEIEGEVFDKSLNANINTYNVIKTNSVLDMTNSLSCIELNPSSQIQYNFLPRITNTTKHFIYVRARNKVLNNNSYINLNINDISTINLNCVNDTNWIWYKARRWFSPNSNKKITITTNGLIEIDKFVITEDPNYISDGNFKECYSIFYKNGDEVNNKLYLKAFPTLTSNNINVIIDSKENKEGELIISDSMFRIYYRKRITTIADYENIHNIDISLFPSGFYNVTFTDFNKMTSDKFIKQ